MDGADGLSGRNSRRVGQMKTDYGWLNGGNGTNSSGFSGLPGGNRLSGGASTPVEPPEAGGVLRPWDPTHGADTWTSATTVSRAATTVRKSAFPFVASKTPSESRGEKRVLGDAFGPLLPRHLDVSEKV